MFEPKVGKDRFILLAAVVACVVAACARKGEKVTPAATAGATAFGPPPVAYVVGKAEVTAEGPEPTAKLNIAVDSTTSGKDIERLLNYFDKERYADYDIVWVNVYFDAAAARSPDVNAAALVATLRVNRPAFREIRFYNEMAETAADVEPVVTSATEEVLYLGRRGRMFDSAKQAQALLDLMEEKPGHAIYRIVWQAPEDMELSYSVAQRMLVRIKRGAYREVWSDMTVEELKRAARGAGFGGKRRHGGGYSFVPETAATEAE